MAAVLYGIWCRVNGCMRLKDDGFIVGVGL